MNSIAERKNILEEQDKSNKISELYDLVQRSEGTAQALPEVVDRLDALQGLHDQGIFMTLSNPIRMYLGVALNLKRLPFMYYYILYFFLLFFSALQFSKALAQLDSVQQKLSANLNTNQDLLKETQKRFTENISNVQENFKNIEGRIDKLTK